MISILLPAADFDFAKMQRVCADFRCRLQWADEKKEQYEISTDEPVNFFWLGINFNHRMGLDAPAKAQNTESPNPVKINKP